MATPEGYREKEALAYLAGQVITDILWHSAAVEWNGETNEHYIHAWREGGVVKSIVGRKGNG